MTEEAQHVSRAAPASRRFGVLVAIETVGAVVLYAKWLPLYRQIVRDPAGHEPQNATLVWVLANSVVMLIAYFGFVHEPPTFQRKHRLAGLLVLFVGRLCFLLPTAIFSLLFISNALQGVLPWPRYLAILIGLFAMFCFTRDLERLGQRLLKR